MKDQIIKFLAHDGKISVVCASTTNLVEEARKLHDLSPLSTATMGRVLTITSLIGAEMKNKTDKLTIQIKGNGPIGKIVAVSDNTPKVKACITNPHADLPLNEFGKLDVGGAIGNQGFINVIKDIGLKEPYIGISPLTSGDENVKLMDDSIEPVYECGCNKEKFADGLMTLGKEQLTELIEEDGKAEIQCQFCNKLYNFNKKELEEILKETK